MPEALEDNEVLQEFCVETDLEKRVICCWIPSKDGKKFKVCWQNLGHLNKDLNGSVRLMELRLEAEFADGGCQALSSCRHFMFSPLRLTDDDSFLDASSVHDLGEITVSIYEALLEIPASSGRDTVHEKSKKGLVHSIGFMPEVKLTGRSSTHVQHKISCDVCVKYRPFEVLQANGIAPRPSSQHGAAFPPQYVDDDETEELEALLSRVREIKERRTKAKRVKTELRRALVPGEVIDLT
ncbi:hypothetical protein BDQ17DRAFT_1358433 [Cyathus striatus]|nr:hypothetical protein BDQ17DRAFT_1358433 [Cyathus striatus]